MPKLKDSRGIFHKSYTSLHKAEMQYQREAKMDSDRLAHIEDKAKLHEGETELERSQRLHLKRPPEVENDSIVITEVKRDKTVIAQEFYCLNCGEDVVKTDVICPTCGIPLDWRNL